MAACLRLETGRLLIHVNEGGLMPSLVDLVFHRIHRSSGPAQRRLLTQWQNIAVDRAEPGCNALVHMHVTEVPCFESGRASMSRYQASNSSGKW